MEQLPNEIKEEILFRLPVKSLISFKCVSKSWLALISSPYFVELHLKRSVQSKSNLRLYLPNYIRREAFDFLQPMVNVDYIPLIFQYYGLAPSSSCDGLLCMSKLCDIDYVFVWNPSTRKYIQLPHESIDFPVKRHDNWMCLYRIGYDNINKDYKVVRIGRLLGTREDVIDYEVKIYSLRSNSWHKPVKFPHPPDMNTFGDSIVGGALHWITSNSKERLIVAVNLGTEKYRLLPQPSEDSGSYKYLYLNNLDGCLSLSCCYSLASPVDVFLLKEYGGKNEHWSKLITLSPTDSFWIYNPMKPITYLNNDKKILFILGLTNLILYNLEEKSVEEIIMGWMGELRGLHICFESLVPVHLPYE